MSSSLGLQRLDFMIDSIPAPSTPAEIEEILRFLRRFSDLMSVGSNSDNLLRAAKMLEAHIDMLKATTALLQAERARGEASAEIQKAAEARMAEYENELSTLRSEFAEQQLSLGRAVSAMEEMQRRLLARAQDAELRLATAQDRPVAIPAGFVLAPLSTLQLAKAQFEALAQAFEKSGNVVSQVMCEASASSLEGIMLDLDTAESEDRSHAA